MISIARPLILAPMAGGPSTPRLCAAVSAAGGLGMLAAGYLTPETLRDALAEVDSLTAAPYGINIFSPPPQSGLDAEQRSQRERYRDRLARAFPAVDLPIEPTTTDDYYEDKVALAAASRAAVVSFTFGYPTAQILDTLHERGKEVILSATTPEEIRHLAATPCDALCVQGAEAGGHRATVLSSAEEGVSYSTAELLVCAREETDKPVIVAGGIATAEDVARYLAAGAYAVQVGTRFLLADEAGTKETHRRALDSLRGRPTAVTAAFSGKLARGLRNAFLDDYSEDAPRLYPEVHYLTSGLRAEANAAGDAECLNLWAGEGYGDARPGSAESIVRELTALVE